MSWHAEPGSLAAYASGRIEDVEALSLEAHVVSCERCRADLAALADRDGLDRVWHGVEAALDAPAPTPFERLLLAVRVPEHAARVLAATPSLSASWLLAVAAALTFAVVAAHASAEGVLVYLGLAPLLPVAGIAAAYGPWLDPAHELALAAPMRSFRLLLLRALAVLTTTTVLAAAAALALPALDLHAAAWLLPALALSLASLALSTYVAPAHACAAVAVAWVGAVSLAALASREELAAFGPEAQLACLLTGLAAAHVLVRRRDTFDRTPTA